MIALAESRTHALAILTILWILVMSEEPRVSCRARRERGSKATQIVSRETSRSANARFRRDGAGSYPPTLIGLQRVSRQSPNPTPTTVPRVRTASIMYCEHEGSNRQYEPNAANNGDNSL